LTALFLDNVGHVVDLHSLHSLRYALSALALLTDNVLRLLRFDDVLTYIKSKQKTPFSSLKLKAARIIGRLPTKCQPFDFPGFSGKK
tara:strand:- start:216 stop:476 length:261 start_codon:yes stop_codon:yes gene_type:complete